MKARVLAALLVVGWLVLFIAAFPAPGSAPCPFPRDAGAE